MWFPHYKVKVELDRWRDFIGFNLVKRLYKDVEDVLGIGIDSMNDYYDVRLKIYMRN